MKTIKASHLVEVTEAKTKKPFVKFTLNINKVDALMELPHDKNTFETHIKGSTTVLFQGYRGESGNKFQIKENIEWFEKQGLLKSFAFCKHGEVNGKVAVNVDNIVFITGDADSEEKLFVYLPSGRIPIMKEKI